MAGNNDLVIFALGERTIGIPSAIVRELIRAVAITGLPGAPAGVTGVIDLRGELIPVVDLSDRLGLAARPVRAADQLVICQGTNGMLAVRADRVLELRTLELEPLPTGAEADPIVRGLARTADGVIVIAELAAFLAEPDHAALAAAIARLRDAA